ncbi:MAG: hypothetical protein JSV80_10760, partial [Acidobacteriota bacterium]
MPRMYSPVVPGAPRRSLAALIAVIGTIVWTHALAGMLRALAGISAEEVAPAAVSLTLAAVVT